MLLTVILIVAAAPVVAFVLLAALAFLLSLVPVSLSGLLMPPNTEWELDRDSYRDWRWESMTRGNKNVGNSMLPLKGPAILHMLLVSWAEWLGIRKHAYGATRPCLICGVPSRVGEPTCGRACEERLAAAAREVRDEAPPVL